MYKEHSRKRISDVTVTFLQCRVTEFALVFQTKKWVTVTELDFVFDNKTVREYLRKY